MEAEVSRPQGVGRTAGTVLAVGIMVVLIGACSAGPGAPGPQGEPGRTLNWATVVEDGNLAESVYLVGIAIPEQGYFPIGTGFAAHYPDTIWTNAHVALAVRATVAELAHDNPVPIAVRSGTPVGGAHTYRLNMDRLRVHPEYDEENDSPDLAVFHVDDAPFENVPAFLPRNLVTQLQVGQPVATMGFPGELSAPAVVPIATFKDGTISALRPYSVDEPEVTPENSKVVQFNLGQTGGTSGSPVFDHEGFIVAVSYSGVTVIPVDEEGYPVPIPVGDLDFGIRVDEVWTLIDLIEADPASAAPAVDSRAYPHRAYHAFPAN